MKNRWTLLAGGLALCALVAGCGNNGETPKESAPAPAPVATAPAEGNAPAAEPQSNIITGKVLQTMDASGYTYMELDMGDKKTWVAMPQSQVNVGDEVSVIYSMTMANFESKTLGRTFDEVIFASGFAPGSGPSATSGSEAPASFNEAVQSAGDDVATATGGSSKAVVPFSELKVDKATGDNAYQVGELYAQKDELAGKTVRVRGKVVKVSKNIMGKNWIHLQDGTGNPMDNTHDLVVTTSEAPNMDDIITVSGVVEADKDFGAGYKYAVILEDVTVSKE